MPPPTTLFGELEPHAIYVTVYGLDDPRDDDRMVTMRVQPKNERSIRITFKVSRYSPEEQILECLGRALGVLNRTQAPVCRELLKGAVDDAIRQGLDPF